ncbi:MAG: TetR/AcrR family transcriptional regulator [Myxococcales bacterium]|nr:TetR/AcrR family transcriptional regulator [Myxococcales bacterium]
MARPRTDPSRPATPQRILAAALEVFAREGFDRASLAEIAKGAGIRRPSLLYHFPSKEALYAAVVRRTFADLAEALAPAMVPTGAFDERLATLARSFATFLGTHPHDARIVMAELLRADGPGNRIVLEQVAPLLDGVVAFIESEGRPHLKPGLPVRDAVLQVVAHTLLQASAHSAVQSALWGPVDPETTWTLTRLLFLAEEV